MKVIKLQHEIAPASRKVVVIFSEKVDLLVMTAEQAVTEAVRLLESAKQSNPAAVNGISWRKHG